MLHVFTCFLHVLFVCFLCYMFFIQIYMFYFYVACFLHVFYFMLHVFTCFIFMLHVCLMQYVFLQRDAAFSGCIDADLSNVHSVFIKSVLVIYKSVLQDNELNSENFGFGASFVSVQFTLAQPEENAYLHFSYMIYFPPSPAASLRSDCYFVGALFFARMAL